MRWLALAACACACRSSSPSSSAGSATGSAVAGEPTLDLGEIDLPFGDVPFTRAFLRAHHVAKVTVHELDPGARPAASRITTVTDYDANGRPVRVSTLSADHDYTWTTTDATTYTLEGDRPVREERVSGQHAVKQKLDYDAAGRVTRVETTDDYGGGEELRTYDAKGRLVKQTRGEVGKPVYATLWFDYDASGRLTSARGSKPNYEHDRYAFAYDGEQLAKVAFVEAGRPIYERGYTYDRDGFLTRVDQHSDVAAMGSEPALYEYELADGTRRVTQAVKLPVPPPRSTDAEIVGALHAVFPHARDEHVVWAGPAGKQYLDTITFELPSVDAALGSAALKDRACLVAKAITKLEREPDGCGCEYLEVAANNHVTFHMQLGC